MRHDGAVSSKASLTLFGHGNLCDVLHLDNGGVSVSDYLLTASVRRAAPGAIQRPRRYRIPTELRLSETSLERLLFPIQAFVIYFITHFAVKVKQSHILMNTQAAYI